MQCGRVDSAMDGTDAPSGREKAIALVGAVLLTVAIVLAATQLGRPWRLYPYRVSSAQAGYPSSATLGYLGAYNLLLHTGEESGPWVEIDLLGERTVQRIVVKQRA